MSDSERNMFDLLLEIGDALASEHPHDWTEPVIAYFAQRIQQATADIAQRHPELFPLLTTDLLQRTRNHEPNACV